MFKILIVEDDEQFAVILRQLIELNPLYEVTAVARDTETAQACIADRLPDLALVDLELANGDSGYDVAEMLVDADVACLFITGAPPEQDAPELAVGCLVKPFGEGDLSHALRCAEDRTRGREPLKLRANRPDNLTLYGDSAYDELQSLEGVDGSPEAVGDAEDTPAKARLLGWVNRLLERRLR
jgi:CheY-like chemotaxis protein